jgi:NAD(P)-dependent dehydrogenase (short-subunit alcohol dehydrogenase family)
LPIDIVVNATGFMHDQGKRIEALTLAEFRQGFDPFLTAYFNIAKAVSPRMGGEHAGTMITVVAPAANMAMPGHPGHIIGCAGTEAFTRALAAELGQKIFVYCVYVRMRLPTRFRRVLMWVNCLPLRRRSWELPWISF